ncbi:MAG: M23 family metallopeptidase [Acidimicrobiia bacterium]|nr:M23 family metallopeptidase [Acidimicrobiia bacterium]
MLRTVVVVVLIWASGSAAYTVQPGDTLSEIANHLGTSVSNVAALNELANSNVIYPGQTLQTPGDTSSATREASHLVLAGETLSGIAASHGVSEEMLIATNGIVDGRVIAGTSLSLEPMLAHFRPATGRTHLVGDGETIGSIASDHDMTVGQIVALNHIHDGVALRPGEVLVLARGWQCPVPRGTFSNDFGWVKASGRVHNGIDIYAPAGSDILAPVTGHLHQARGPAGGLQFSLRGVDGVTYFGSHMATFGASGDVAAGDIIGTVGTSGNAAGTSAHLHFEVHPGHGDRAANPYGALKATCR